MPPFPKIPKNRTAELLLILRHVSNGHYFWTADEIAVEKLHRLLTKWQHYALTAKPHQRLYRKKTQRASTQLVIGHGYAAGTRPILTDGASAEMPGVPNPETAEMPVPLATPVTPWIMLGTPGKDGLVDGAATPGAVKDARSRHGRIEWHGYQLVQLPKTYPTAEGKLKTETTWTWRLTATRYREWEAAVVELAKRKETARLQETFAVLARLPMFAGVRQQVFKLHREANKLLGKTQGERLHPLELPFVTMSQLYGE